MAETIIERIRAEKEARKAAREAHVDSTELKQNVRASDQAPEIAFIEAFLTRFTDNVVPMVSKAMTQELQSALRPFYHDVRESIRETFDDTATEISKGLAALEQYAAAAVAKVEAVAMVAEPEASDPPRPSPPRLPGTCRERPIENACAADESNAVTDLEIPMNKLKRELKRIVEDPTALQPLAEEPESPPGRHDTIILDDQTNRNSHKWASATSAFTNAAAETRCTTVLDDLTGLNDKELEALEEAAIAGTISFHTGAQSRSAPDESEESPEQKEEEPEEVEAKEKESDETGKSATAQAATGPESSGQTRSPFGVDGSTRTGQVWQAPAVDAITSPEQLTELVRAIQQGQDQLVEKIEYIEALISTNFENLVARFESAVDLGIKKASSAKVD